MHIKAQAQIITDKIYSAKQSARLLVKHVEKLGLDNMAKELVKGIDADLAEATKAIRGED